jgi:hypothetical protein
LKAKKCAGYFEASFFPESFELARFTLDQLLLAASRGSVDFRGWPFLYIHPNTPDRTYAIEDGLETFVQTKDLAASHNKDDGVECVVDFRAAAIYIAEAMHCLTRLYDGLLDDGEEVSLMSGLVGSQDRVLVSLGSSSMPLFERYVCRIPEIVIERRHALADWRAGLIDHAVEIANEVYQRFNWPNPNLAAARTAIEKMFARRW